MDRQQEQAPQEEIGEHRESGDVELPQHKVRRRRNDAETRRRCDSPPLPATSIMYACIGQLLCLGLGLVLDLGNFYRGKGGRSPVSPLLGSATDDDNCEVCYRA